MKRHDDFARLSHLAKRIRVRGECWCWTGATRNGYGVGTFARRFYLAHRAVYEMLVGPIAPGLVVDHLCRNRRCVRPEHLEVVTQAENLARSMHPTYLVRREGVCKRGHAVAGANAFVYKGRKGPRCGECYRAAQRAWYERKVAKRAAERRAA